MNDADALMGEARQHVDRAIRAAVGAYAGWENLDPATGLNGGLAVIRLAERRTYEYAVRLRGEGTTWAEIADLLGVPYSDSYARLEHTYELVRGPIPDDAGPWDQHNLYWKCGGPDGCGAYITDRGPYESHPADNESGHADTCRRAAAEAEAHRLASEERDRRGRVIQEAFDALTHPGDRVTVERCWATLRRGGEISGKWSLSEQLAVALVLGDDDFLRRTAYKTRADAIHRTFACTPGQARARLAAMRAAATGETS